MWTFFFSCAFLLLKTLHDACGWPFASHAESCGGAPHRVKPTVFTIGYLYLCTCIVVVGDKHTPHVPAKAFIIIISKEQESNL